LNPLISRIQVERSNRDAEPRGRGGCRVIACGASAVDAPAGHVDR
jgi:hypothetical protein